MKLTDLYEGIIETLGFEYNRATGAVSSMSLAGSTPVMLDTKQGERRLVIPYYEVLKNPDWNHTVAFHPVSENIARTDSDILKFVQRFGAASLNFSIDMVMNTLITWCADKDSHSNLNHKQNVFLSLFPNADEKAVKTWEKISDKIGDNNQLVKIATLRNKELEGQSYLRVGYVKFPFYTALVNILENDEEPAVFGVKLRKKDVEGFKALFEFVFKHVSTPDAYYSYGSRSNTAPTFHAFINAYVNVYKDILRVANLLKLKDFPQLKWGDAVKDLSEYRGQIPALPGNEGDVTEADKLNQQLSLQTTTPTAPTLPVVQPQVLSAPQPVQPVQPVATPAPANINPGMLASAPGRQGGGTRVLTQAEQQAIRAQQNPQMAQAQPMQQPNAFAQPMQPAGYGYPQPQMGYVQPMMANPAMMNNPFAGNPNLLSPAQQQQMQQQMYPVNNTAFQNPPMPMNNGWVNPMMGQPQMGYGYGNMMVNPMAVQNTMNYGRLR